MAAADIHDRPAQHGDDKLLAIGVYGETVAAYRYLVLAEKAATPTDRRRFADLADEEQAHKQRLQKTMAERFPKADFVLSQDDKDLVVSGPRLLDVHREITFAESLALLLDTESKTSDFYGSHGPTISDPSLRLLFQQLADESREHHCRLRDWAAGEGLTVAPAV
jgi:rubrerythrin